MASNKFKFCVITRVACKRDIEKFASRVNACIQELYEIIQSMSKQGNWLIEDLIYSSPNRMYWLHYYSRQPMVDRRHMAKWGCCCKSHKAITAHFRNSIARRSYVWFNVPFKFTGNIARDHCWCINYIVQPKISVCFVARRRRRCCRLFVISAT